MTRRKRRTGWTRVVTFGAAAVAVGAGMWMMTTDPAPSQAAAMPQQQLAAPETAGNAEAIAVGAGSTEFVLSTAPMRDDRQADSDRRGEALKQLFNTQENGAAYVEGIDGPIPLSAQPKKLDLTQRPKAAPTKR